MFKVGKKAKIIIVVEIYTLYSARAGGLLDLAIKLQSLFGDYFYEIINSCMLVVTKVNLEPQTLFNIKGKLKKFTDASIDLKKEAKILIDTLITKDRIKIFPVPTQINDSVID